MSTRNIVTRFFLCVIFVSCFFLSSCTPVEKTARDAIASAKGVLSYYYTLYPECVNPTIPVSSVCLKLGKAVAAKDLAIDALETFCAGTDFAAGGHCNAPSRKSPGYQQVYDKLAAAVSEMSQIISDVKKLPVKK